ncbi:MAG: lysostaphin resistance A-like protein [Candidatus Thorarchaeota archaeon]
MWDPDPVELEYSESIDIFSPDTNIESSMTMNQAVKVVGHVILGLVLMVLATVPILLIMIPFGLVDINIYTGSVWIDPNAVAILSLTELLLVVPPIYYIKKRGLPIRSIGFKAEFPIKEVLLGLTVGMFMISLNYVMSWALYQIPGIPVPEDSSMFHSKSLPEVIMLVGVMMLVVGPTEEILFRGFLQRRLEIYYYNHKRDYRMWALAMTSFIFAVTHLDISGLAIRFVLGLILGYLAQKQKYSLLAPSVAHGVNNSMIIILGFLGF